MSSHIVATGNIGADPDYHQYANDADPDSPHRLLRMRLYVDNPIPVEDGYEDRGGYWASVVWWHQDAQQWSQLYQKGMRVIVAGRIIRKDWTDREGNLQVSLEINADYIGILPYRIDSVVMRPKSPAGHDAPTAPPED